MNGKAIFFGRMSIKIAVQLALLVLVIALVGVAALSVTTVSSPSNSKHMENMYQLTNVVVDDNSWIRSGRRFKDARPGRILRRDNLQGWPGSPW